jgi:hypothetical protein
MQDLYISLIHYPIYNKAGDVVTTSVTNFDLHDIARNAQTFGVKGFFVITPSAVQMDMVNYIKNYWHEGHGSTYNPDRKKAFDVVNVSENIEDTCLTIKNWSGSQPLLVATTAKDRGNSVGYDYISNLIANGDRPVLVNFGTGHGLTDEFFEKINYTLKPIPGVNGYNHLPVRSAVAIILDRLVGR